MKKKMLKQQIKSVFYRFVLATCVMVPILLCDGLFDYTRNYLILLAVCLVAGFMAFDGFVNAEQKLYWMRKRAVRLRNEDAVPDDNAA